MNKYMYHYLNGYAYLLMFEDAAVHYIFYSMLSSFIISVFFKDREILFHISSVAITFVIQLIMSALLRGSTPL